MRMKDSIIKNDSSYQYIYDFMQEVVKEVKLNKKFGLNRKPELSCYINENDEDFLRTLIYDGKMKKKIIKSSGYDILIEETIFELPKCLTVEDIDYMLNQKDELKNFMWNPSKLGFSNSNNDNWYIFSVPLFSKDRNKAVMMIRDLCPGLCGGGRTVVFIKEGSTWESYSNFGWIH